MDVQVAGALLALVMLTSIVVVLARLAIAQRARIARLEEAATTDPLTGLLNRRGFQARMEVELARAEREGTPLALMVADADELKAINDSLGHIGGDMALERLAGVIRSTTRTVDGEARLGGDEFAFILPSTTGIEALSLAERLRTEIEESFRGTPVKLTLSLGVASYPMHGRTAEELLHTADRAMYKAKALVKNRVALPEIGSAGDGLRGSKRRPAPMPSHR